MNPLSTKVSFPMYTMIFFGTIIKSTKDFLKYSSTTAKDPDYNSSDKMEILLIIYF